MPLLANTILVWFYIARHSRHRAAATVKFFVGILVLCICIFLVPNTLTKRSVNLFSAANIEYFQEAYGSIDPGREPLEFSAITVPDDSDMSWMMRMVKWVYAIKVWRANPVCWFLGVGPGTWGPALDGGWLRLLTENGVIGLVLFVLMLRCRDCNQSIMGPIRCCLFINMLMIDLNIAYKAMAFVLFVLGYCMSRKSASGEPAFTE